MRSSVIFNGPPGSGKDEACLFLENNLGFEHLSFKQELFSDTIEYFQVSRNWFMDDYENRETKERPEEKLNGFSRREAMIYVSEKVMKPHLGKDYYGQQVANKMNGVSDYCFSDGGFVDEVLPVINSIGTDNICIVQLFRHGCSFSTDSRSYINGIFEEEFVLGSKSGTIKAKGTDNVPIRMYRIHNNGTVGDFHQTVRKILRKEANVRKENTLSRKPL